MNNECPNAQNEKGDRIKGLCGCNPDELLTDIENLKGDIKALLDMLTEEYIGEHPDAVDPLGIGVPDWLVMAHSLAGPPEDHTPYEPHDLWQRGE